MEMDYAASLLDASRRIGGLEPPVEVRVVARLRPVGHAQLPVDVREVVLHGPLGDPEVSRDAGVGGAGGDHPQDLQLPPRERVAGELCIGRGGRDGVIDVAEGDLADERRQAARVAVPGDGGVDACVHRHCEGGSVHASREQQELRPRGGLPDVRHAGEQRMRGRHRVEYDDVGGRKGDGPRARTESVEQAGHRTAPGTAQLREHELTRGDVARHDRDRDHGKRLSAEGWALPAVVDSISARSWAFSASNESRSTSQSSRNKAAAWVWPSLLASSSKTGSRAQVSSLSRMRSSRFRIVSSAGCRRRRSPIPTPLLVLPSSTPSTLVGGAGSWKVQFASSPGAFRLTQGAPRGVYVGEDGGTARGAIHAPEGEGAMGRYLLHRGRMDQVVPAPASSTVAACSTRNRTRCLM